MVKYRSKSINSTNKIKRLHGQRCYIPTIKSWKNSNYKFHPHNTSFTHRYYYYPFFFYPNFYYRNVAINPHTHKYIPETEHVENFVTNNYGSKKKFLLIIITIAIIILLI